MKSLLSVFALILSVAAFSQDPSPYAYDLKVIVMSIRTRRLIENTLVRVMNQDKQLIFEGCTDSLGEVYLDQSLMLPNSTYTISIFHDRFPEDKRGVTISTVDMSYSKNFVVEMALVSLECWYFPCYAPVPGNQASEIETILKDFQWARTTIVEEYGERYATKEVGITIEFSTLEEEKALRAEGKLVLKRLQKEFPDLKIHWEIIMDYLPDHEHSACLRVTRMG
jgi:hypothetical protein